ncbi:ferrochelatase [Thiotrichales bacterium 19S9-12]|nr:ferrochelatase [Thiotrichales bacterium 19S9-11]MCF6812052.1 ferrochelatase [Thiotrichales bacterium 19S9-12]
MSHKKGVLLVNLGTPDQPTAKAIKAYLKPFLSDPRVINNQGIIWKFILHGIILNTRPKKVAKLYQAVWKKFDQSPLLYYSIKQKEKLQIALGDNYQVELAMRYGNPSIGSAFASLKQLGVKEIIVLPVYPQNSATTVASVYDDICAALVEEREIPSMRFISGYHQNPLYIEALVNSVREFQATHGIPDKLIFSYHGLPKAYIEKGDPYEKACYETTGAVIKVLGLSSDQYMTCFQSRVGPAQWLQPYFDKTLEKLPQEGIKSIQVISPAFASDCLETIEEINIAGRETFLSSGGKKFNYIECLNDSPEHISLLESLIKY